MKPPKQISAYHHRAETPAQTPDVSRSLEGINAAKQIVVTVTVP